MSGEEWRGHQQVTKKVTGWKMRVRSAEQCTGGKSAYVVHGGRLVRRHSSTLRGRGARGLLLFVEVVIALYVVANSFAAMAAPLNRDEGAFLTIARVILHGGLPYRDVFDQKSPGIYYLLAGLIALTGGLTPLAQVLVIRAVVVLANVATAGGLLLLGRRWWSLEVGIVGAALWLLGLTVFEGDHFFTEPFAVVAAVFALVVVAYFPTLRGALCAGLLLALGSLFKQTAVLAAPGVALLLLPNWHRTRGWWRPNRALLVRLGALVAGFIAPWLLICAAFALAGAFTPMWQQIVVSNLTHYPSDDSGLRGRLGLGIGPFPLIWLVPVVLGLAGIARWLGWWPWRRRGPAPSQASVALWIVMLLAGVPLATHSYLHYWLQLLPSAALLTALAIFSALDGWHMVSTRILAGGMPFRLLMPAVLLVLQLLALGNPLPRTQFGNFWGELRGQDAAGQVIATHTAPGSRIVVMPAEAEYYFLSDRMPATPTIYIQTINLTPTLVSSIETDLDGYRYGAVVWIRGVFTNWPQIIAIHHQLTTHYHLVATAAQRSIEVWLPNAMVAGGRTALTLSDRAVREHPDQVTRHRE
jgi:4-amino-4-deoxy-L-arabinose transferase-like glycosyltransferase